MKKWFLSACEAVVAAAVLVASLSTASCEKYILPHLDCTLDTIWAPLEGGTYQVTISSNVSWKFELTSIPAWASVDVTYGQSDYEEAVYPIKVEVQPNDGDSGRNGAIKYSSQTLTRTLVISQTGPATAQDSEAAGE